MNAGTSDSLKIHCLLLRLLLINWAIAWRIYVGMNSEKKQMIETARILVLCRRLKGIHFEIYCFSWRKNAVRWFRHVSVRTHKTYVVN